MSISEYGLMQLKKDYIFPNSVEYHCSEDMKDSKIELLKSFYRQVVRTKGKIHARYLKTSVEEVRRMLSDEIVEYKHFLEIAQKEEQEEKRQERYMQYLELKEEFENA